MYRRTAHPHIRVVHHLPERTRLRLPPEQRHSGRLASVSQALQDVPGIHDVETNYKTGSLVVHHDPDPSILSSIGHSLEDMLGLALELGEDGVEDGGGASILSHLVQGTVSRLDGNVSNATGSWLDLKMLVPMALVGAGVTRATESGIGWANIPAFVFFYYALDTYIKFHRQPGEPLHKAPVHN